MNQKTHEGLTETILFIHHGFGLYLSHNIGRELDSRYQSCPVVDLFLPGRRNDRKMSTFRRRFQELQPRSSRPSDLGHERHLKRASSTNGLLITLLGSSYDNEVIAIAGRWQ